MNSPLKSEPGGSRRVADLLMATDDDLADVVVPVRGGPTPEELVSRVTLTGTDELAEVLRHWLGSHNHAR